MAEKWINNDSAREMTRKYNETATELNRLARTTLGINESYVTLAPSEFSIVDDPEEAQDGA